MSGLLAVIASIPFFFLPKIPKTSQKQRKNSSSPNVLQTDKEKNHMTNLFKQEKKASANMTGKDFIVSLCEDVNPTET